MLDFTDRESVGKNTLVAKELIKHLSVTELMRLYADAQPDKDCSLDFTEIVEGILETNDDGKILVLGVFLDDTGTETTEVTKALDTILGNGSNLPSNVPTIPSGQKNGNRSPTL